MSICIISDHIIMLRQNFIIMLSILKPKYEGGASAPKPSPPGSAPAMAVQMPHVSVERRTCDVTNRSVPYTRTHVRMIG